MEWISNKKQLPKRYGLYLVSDDYSWYVKLIKQGAILRYDEADDGYCRDKEWENKEWWWMELPNRPDGASPFYD